MAMFTLTWGSWIQPMPWCSIAVRSIFILVPPLIPWSFKCSFHLSFSDQNFAWISHAICTKSPLTILNFIYLTTDKEWKFIQLMYDSCFQFLIFKEYYASFTRPGTLSWFRICCLLWCTATFVTEAQRMDQNITNLYIEESVIIFTINIFSLSLLEVELMSRSRW
jgi:hypothetical protein